ncbi:MotA/TolQ/ExbB proton channel family protein [Telmatospirillum sp.]|uniref:motility protein A n=1 Tax=Telmatospirillum sp. TaxID=2079197 RepID=UPI00283F742A|nr:MotA/TolQ/ExbB proton channel family protein [Telmatospirillum sp.]MDR3439310.1 MotA/TolQ/ExbB proton channel family protein [Telmatospirillum sp.]
MSFPTLIGFLLGIGLFISSVVLSTDNYMIFVHLTGFIMVIGGTTAATFVAFEPRYVSQAVRITISIFFQHKLGRAQLTNEVGRMIRWGYMVQKGGLPALEADAKALRKQDSFLAFGIDLVISGYTGQEVREILSNTIETTFHRHIVPADVLRQMANNAPAFGMIATLVGLVVMLDKMGNDPSKVGPGMAVGLMGTLYGVTFARIILMPTASKVQQREEIVRFRQYLVAEGLALLAERRSPRYIQDKMNSFLDPALHFDIDRMLRNRG